VKVSPDHPEPYTRKAKRRRLRVPRIRIPEDARPEEFPQDEGWHRFGEHAITSSEIGRGRIVCAETQSHDLIRHRSSWMSRGRETWRIYCRRCGEFGGFVTGDAVID